VTGDALDVTVLVTTCNRAAILARTLESFARLDSADLRWEIIVVDNGSTDTTPAVLQAFMTRVPLRAIEEPRPRKARALNRALPLVRGGTVLFADDDILPRPDWMLEMMRAVRRWPDDSIFGGRIVPVFPPDTPAWIRHLRHSGSLFARFTPDLPEGPMTRTPFGANYAVRTAALAGRQFAVHLGPSGESYPTGDELELLMRLTRAGHRVIFVPASEVGHVIRDEQLQPAWLFQRAHNVGRGRAQAASWFANPRGPAAACRRWLADGALRWRLLTSGALHRAFGPFDRRAAMDYGFLFHRSLGELHERRLLARERPASARRRDRPTQEVR
jgi:glycosyltransferase involved in cell wall biosynthesis